MFLREGMLLQWEICSHNQKAGRMDFYLPHGVGISVCPWHFRQVMVPLVIELDSMFSEHGLQHPVKALYHPITLGMVGSGIQFSDS